MPRLSGRRVRLRAIEPNDFEYLYRLATSEKVGLRWRLRGTTPNPDDFIRTLWDGVFAQFLVEQRDGAPAGHVMCYGAHPRDGVASIGMVADPALLGTGMVLEAMFLFVSYLFDVGGFRKLYAEVPEYNLDQFGSGAGRYFHEEGRLRDHEWYMDRYWDVLHLAIYRDEWRTASRRVMAWIEAGA